MVRDEATGAGSRQWQSGWASEMQSQMRACVRACARADLLLFV